MVHTSNPWEYIGKVAINGVLYNKDKDNKTTSAGNISIQTEKTNRTELLLISISV